MTKFATILLFSLPLFKTNVGILKKKIDPYGETYFLCLEHIKKYEKFSECSYIDNDGSVAIGYGHHLLIGESFSEPITKYQADSILISDFNKRIGVINRENPNISYNKTLCLSLFIYNIGETKYRSSTLNKLVKQNKSIDNEIIKWCHFTDSGKVKKNVKLLKRREFELKIWKKDEIY